MDNVLSLQRQETTYVDSEAVAVLERALGPRRCREVLEEACFDMIDRLAGIELALHEKNYDKARAIASSISALSAQIGLDDFSFAARNLKDCLQTDDKTAHSAVAARLMRLGETTLLSVLQLTEDPYL